MDGFVNVQEQVNRRFLVAPQLAQFVEYVFR